MISEKSDSVLAIQAVLGRTHKGRRISEQAKESVSAWPKNTNSGYRKMECQLCGLILTSNYFIKGCPNCGSTDNRSIG